MQKKIFRRGRVVPDFPVDGHICWLKLQIITLVYFFIIAESLFKRLRLSEWQMFNTTKVNKSGRKVILYLFAEIKDHNCYYSVCMNSAKT